MNAPPYPCAGQHKTLWSYPLIQVTPTCPNIFITRRRKHVHARNNNIRTPGHKPRGDRRLLPDCVCDPITSYNVMSPIPEVVICVHDFFSHTRMCISFVIRSTIGRRAISSWICYYVLRCTDKLATRDTYAGDENDDPGSKIRTWV